jgi:hypothetical protein
MLNADGQFIKCCISDLQSTHKPACYYTLTYVMLCLSDVATRHVAPPLTGLGLSSASCASHMHVQ